MSSPPATPRQKAGPGIRQPMEPFDSHSQSLSQPLPQLGPRSPSTVTGSNNGAGRGVSLVDNNATIVRPASTSSGPREQAQAASGTPANVEPIGAAQEITSRGDTTTTDAQSNLSPIDSPSELVSKPSGTLLIAEHMDAVLTLATPASMPSAARRKNQNIAWNGLRESLRFFRETSSASPQVSSATDSLLSCLDGLEISVQNHQDYEDLATELTTLIQSLKQYMDGSSALLMSGSTSRIAMDIENQVSEIREVLGPTQAGGIRDAKTEEELVRHYRQIQSYFQLLKINARMSALNISKESLAKTNLEGLNPAKQATYDSSLSTGINRRGCTVGTRIGVLRGLDSWLYDPSSSPIYWMNGMAGTGKTTIASTFCERVERSKLLAASFFCTRSSAECRNAARIVPTIAHQLAGYSIPFRSALCKILEKTPDIGSRSMLKQFEQLLMEPLQQVKDAIPHNLVVVIDALDECDDRNGVELVLDMLFRHAAQVPLKFLVTSRPEPEIYGKMSTYSQSREVLRLHDIEQSLVRADIELYLIEEFRYMPLSLAEIEQLAKRSGKLFIYAATLVRYISNKQPVDRHKRLRAILDTAPGKAKRHAEIDALYTTVLRSALGEGEPEAGKTEDIRLVLWTVLLVQEPISAATIAQLAGIDDPPRVVYALDSLRSVLHQSEETGLTSILHASFPDFMFSNERSGLYLCDVPEHSQLLAQRCFLVMKQQLRFNICELSCSFLPDAEVKRIEERIESKISPTLAYACRYWASHLALAPKSHPLLQMFDDFLSYRLLFWMEVLSLRRELPMGVDGLLRAQRWLRLPGSSSSELMLFVDDARSFITEYAVNPSSNSTPHIYLSSLAFCPQSNSVYKHYWKRTRGLLELKGSLMERREAASLAIWTVVSEIISLTLSPDGTRVAIGCLDDTVSILSAYDGTIHVGPLEGHPNTVNSVAFSSDGGRVVSASLGSIRVWNAYNGIQVAGPFRGHMRYINSVSFSPDGTRLVSGGHDCTVRVWNAYDATPLLDPLEGHTDSVLCVTFSPDGNLIASSSSDHTVRLWNSHNGTPATSPLKGHTGSVDSLAFTPDGTRLVSGSGDTIRVWRVPDGSLVANSFEGYSNGVNTLAVSPDGTRIAAGCDDYAVRVWKIEDGKLVAGPFFGHTDVVKSVAYSPDGTRVFSGSVDKTVRVWNVRDGIFPPPPLPPQKAVMNIKSVIFCPDSLHFLSSGGQGVLRMWDTTDGSFTTVPEEASFFPTPLSILSPDGSCIASTSKGGMVQITSTASGSLVAGPFDVDRSSLSAFWFSHNSKAIIMGCRDGMIKVCNLQSGNVTVGSFVGHHKGVSSLAESPDGSLLVSYSDFEFALRVWNILSPALDLELFNNAS
ncbi:hypothetical protein FRC11_004956, partial [Ceratobasidium sp. 423]